MNPLLRPLPRRQIVLGGDSNWISTVEVLANGQQTVDWMGAAENGSTTGTASLLGFYTTKVLPLTDFDDWVSPEFANLDIPLDQYLKQQGASEEALRLINVASNTTDAAKISAMLVSSRLLSRRRFTCSAEALPTTRKPWCRTPGAASFDATTSTASSSPASSPATPPPWSGSVPTRSW